MLQIPSLDLTEPNKSRNKINNEPDENRKCKRKRPESTKYENEDLSLKKLKSSPYGSPQVKTRSMVEVCKMAPGIFFFALLVRRRASLLVELIHFRFS